MAVQGTRPFAGGGVRPAALALLAIGVIVAAPRAARAETHKDARLGFSLNYPQKWKVLPISPDEKTVVASFQSEREFEYRDDKTSSYDLHKPQLDVVIIPLDAGTKSGPTVERSGGDIVVTFGTRYKDLKDYLEKAVERRGWGGFFFSKEAEVKLPGAAKVTFYEITIEKLADGPKRVFAWAFHAEDAIYGLVGDTLIKFEEKVKPDLEAAARSFRLFPRTGVLPGNVTTGKGGDVVVKDPDKADKETPEEKKKSRDDEFNSYLARTKETLPSDWKVKESAHFVCISHTDEKTTRDLLDHAEALRGWLDESLGFIGKVEAGRTLLRICENHDEYLAMYKTGGWRSMRFEIYTYKDREFAADTRLWELNQSLFRTWREAKNDDLSGRMPIWLNIGLRGCVKTAVSKGKKVEFKPSGDTNEHMAAIVRSPENLISAKDFISEPTETIAKRPDIYRQAEFFARFLLTGASQRNPKYKGVLRSYLANLVVAIEEELKAERESRGSDEGEPESEAEETARAAARENRWKEREKEILKKLAEQTFPGWTDKDWDAFNRAYFKDLGV